MSRRCTYGPVDARQFISSVDCFVIILSLGLTAFVAALRALGGVLAAIAWALGAPDEIGAAKDIATGAAATIGTVVIVNVMLRFWRLGTALRKSRS